MNLLKTIQKSIHLLPAKDIPYAQKFIDKRDFQSLYEIVDSDIKKIEREMSKEEPREEYLKLDLDGLVELRDFIIIYKEPLDVTMVPYDDDEDEY